MSEIWKPIKDYEGYYEISSYGRIRSLGKTYKERHYSKMVTRTSPPKTLSQTYDKDGYLKVALIKDGKMKRFFVHRLVALNFIDNEEQKEQVNHINGVKDDNRVENLEWVTPQENTIHAHKMGFCGINGKSRQVAQLDGNDNIINVFESCRQATISIGKLAKNTNIAKVCRKGYGHVGGYGWKYISLEEYLAFKKILERI